MTRKTVTAASLLAACTLGSLAPAASADEFIKGIKITPTKVVDGWVIDTYDVFASFDIVRDNKPDETIYFSVQLREVDTPGWDDFFGPLTVCVAPNQWSQSVGGKWIAGVGLNFKGISDWYGDDWTVQGEDVDEVNCEVALGHVGGSVDELDDGQFMYAYLLENDPTNSAMDPSLVIVAADVGDYHFDLGAGIPHGEANVVFVDDNRPPMVDDEFTQVSTVQYVLHFNDGSTYEGTTVGPDLGQQPCIADFNQDGAQNVLDFVAFQAAFDAQDPASDVNQDGVHNVLDFIAFQAEFDAGC